MDFFSGSVIALVNSTLKAPEVERGNAFGPSRTCSMVTRLGWTEVEISILLAMHSHVPQNTGREQNLC